MAPSDTSQYDGNEQKIFLIIKVHRILPKKFFASEYEKKLIFCSVTYLPKMAPSGTSQYK